MEYKIGSLADLISGTDTAKKEIKKSVFVPPAPTVQKPSKKVSFEKKVKTAVVPSITKNNKAKKLQKLKKLVALKSIDKSGENGVSVKKAKQSPVIAKNKKYSKPEKISAVEQVEGASPPQVLSKNKKKKLRRQNELKLAEKSKADELMKTEGDAENSEITENLEEMEESDDEKVEESDIFKNEELKKRTIFVGNLPNCLKKSHLKKLFLQYGEIQSVRFRGAPLADPRTPKKVAVIKQEFHPNRTNINGFVCFKSEESATKAIKANGTVVKDHHLRVDLASNDNGLYDNTKAIFIGNLDFSTEEDHLWNAFSECGNIQSVRIVRDKKTNMGKGFGFINFVTTDAVELALKLDGTEVKGRDVRVKRIQHNPGQKLISANDSKKPYNIKKRDAFGNKNRKRYEGNSKTKVPAGRPGVKKPESTEKRTPFEGIKSEKKKKKNVNRGELIKKKMVKRLAPKSK